MNSVLPEGWSEKHLDKAIHILSGCPFDSSLFTNDASKKGLIRIRDLNSQSLQTFYAGSYDEVFVVTKGDILVGMDGDFAIVKWRDKDALLNQRICKIEVSKPSELCLEYLYYRLNPALEKINQETGSTTVKHLSTKDLKSLQIPIPPLIEQEKIAAVLGAVDDVIEKTALQIKKLNDLKKSTMNELLTRGIGHTDFKPSELGQIPKRWEVVNLENLTNRIGDGLHSTPKYVETSAYYFINGNNLDNGRIKIFESTKCISQKEYLRHKIELDTNTLLLSINGTIGNLAFYNGEQVVLGKSAAFINLNEKALPRFIYFFLMSERAKSYFIHELTGTTIANLSLKSIRSTPVTLPPLPEQKQITSILDSISTQIEKVENKLASLNALKKSLMQDLLSGRVRVRV